MTNGAHGVTTADELQPWDSNTNSDLQMFVRVTVMGRPTTNGAHEVMTADKLQPWDCNTKFDPKCY